MEQENSSQCFLKSSFMTLYQWCRSLLSIGGNNLQFYPNFALFSTLGGMNLDHDFVQVWKFSEDQKIKGLHQKKNTFSPNSGEHQKKVFHKNRTLFSPNLHAPMYTHSNYWGDADVDHSQTIGGIQPNYWGDISPNNLAVSPSRVPI